MKPEGLAAFSFRKEEKLKIYAYENPVKVLDKSYEKKFKSEKSAWKFFKSMAQSYQKTALRWIMSAKQEETRLKRLDELIRDCALGKKIKAMKYGKK